MRLTILFFAMATLFADISIAQQAVPGEFIIRFKSMNHAKRYYSGGQSRGLGHYKMVTTRIAPIAILKASNSRVTYNTLKKDPNIAYIEPNYIYKIPALRSRLDAYLNRVPTDSDFSKLWGLHNVGQLGGEKQTDINALKAWDLTKGHKKIKIAIIDTGVDYSHPDLRENMWKNPGEIPGNGKDDDGNGYVDDVYGYDFINDDADPMDDNRHGTHCAGTIGAKHNKFGVAGVMNDVQLMALKFISAENGGTLEAALKAIEYATVMGANVMSNSWGGGGHSKALYEAIKVAGERGIVFVAASGNDGKNNDPSPTYPASYDLPNVISVAAIEANGKKAPFSNFGVNTVHVAAPGSGIYSTTPGGTYESLSGTSMATPHVSGVVGLVLSKLGTRSMATMRARLIGTSTKRESLSSVSKSKGYVDALAAITGKKSDR